MPFGKTSLFFLLKLYDFFIKVIAVFNFEFPQNLPTFAT